jgi:ribosome-binding protein aMBF1 (putative translation factor)
MWESLWQSAVMASDPRPVHVSPSAVAALLAAKRTEGLTKSDVARMARMTPSNLREYETGRRRGSSIDVRRRLAGALKVRLADITCDCTDGRCMPGGDL